MSSDEVRVEVARRLVGNHEHRLVDEGAGDRDALLLAAGQFDRVGVRAVLQAHPLQDLERAPALLHVGHAEDAQREHHVLEHGLARDQLEVLEDEAEARR